MADRDATPYARQPPRAFWRSAVAERHPLDIAEVYAPRFPIAATTRIATAGSCFAQHIGRELRQRGLAYLDLEPAPEGLPPAQQLDFGYGMYSARYGNVYTSRQLRQMLDRALGRFEPPDAIWSEGDRHYDAFRPSIEPEGFASVEELVAIRRHHLAQVLKLVEQAEVFVFTLGLTETWVSRESGAAYPTCPGTIAGTFDATKHVLVNLSHDEVVADMTAFFHAARQINPRLRMLLTVSPVPLTATATSDHVMVATTRSKSVLRAAAATLCDRHPEIDYFPSYELVSAAPMRGMFFEPNMRSVSLHGVRHVMGQFFRGHPDALVPAAAAPAAEPANPAAQSRLERAEARAGAQLPRAEARAARRAARLARMAAQGSAPAGKPGTGTAPAGKPPASHDDDIVCDEEILDTFGR
jgi:hypothetical protein